MKLAIASIARRIMPNLKTQQINLASSASAARRLCRTENEVCMIPTPICWEQCPYPPLQTCQEFVKVLFKPPTLTSALDSRQRRRLLGCLCNSQIFRDTANCGGRPALKTIDNFLWAMMCFSTLRATKGAQSGIKRRGNTNGSRS